MGPLYESPKAFAMVITSSGSIELKQLLDVCMGEVSLFRDAISFNLFFFSIFLFRFFICVAFVCMGI